MKKEKVFYVTKKFLKKIKANCEVYVQHMPLILVNGKQMNTKTFEWKSKEEMLEDDLFKRSRVILLMEPNKRSIKDMFKVLEDAEYTNNYKKADHIIGRFYIGD